MSRTPQYVRRFGPRLPRSLACRRWLFSLLAWLAAWCPVASADKEPSEYQVKAAFVFNFVKFVEWPGAKMGNTSEPVVIGVLGTNPFGTLLEQTVSNQTINGHKLVVRGVANTDEAVQCHVLFISHSEKSRLRQWLAPLKDKPVLTVGESKGFAQEGGIINLNVLNDNIKLEINPSAAEAAGLRISSKLLSLARIIKPSEP